jgi:hypothetical protein
MESELYQSPRQPDADAEAMVMLELVTESASSSQPIPRMIADGQLMVVEVTQCFQSYPMLVSLPESSAKL